MSRLTKSKPRLAGGRKHRRKRAVQALVAGAALAGGTQTYASVIRFGNPPGPSHFDWTTAGASILNIQVDALSQTGVAAPGNFQFYSYYGTAIKGLPAAANNLQRTTDSQGFAFAVGFAAGTSLPVPAFDWSAAFVNCTYPGSEGSQLPEGIATYLSVRFTDPAGLHYGWIGVTRDGFDLDAFAWGYETEPGVAIAAGAVPEPGSLALLAFGATAVAARRRRKAVN